MAESKVGREANSLHAIQSIKQPFHKEIAGKTNPTWHKTTTSRGFKSKTSRFNQIKTPKTLL